MSPWTLPKNTPRWPRFRRTCRRYAPIHLLRIHSVAHIPFVDSQLKEQVDELDKENGWDLVTQLDALNLEPTPPVAAASSSQALSSRGARTTKAAKDDDADDDISLPDWASQCKGFNPAITPALEWTFDNIYAWLNLCVQEDSTLTPPTLVHLEKYEPYEYRPGKYDSPTMRCTFADAQGNRVVVEGISVTPICMAYGAEHCAAATPIRAVAGRGNRKAPMLLAPEETVPLPYPFLPSPNTPKAHAEYPRWAYHDFVVTERAKVKTAFTWEHMADINRRWAARTA